MTDPLAAVPVFDALPEADRVELDGLLQRERAPRGRVLFEEGEQGDRLYVLLDGKVKISRSSRDGRENLLAVLGAGELFGELSLFDPGPRTATATTLTDCELVTLGHDELRPWLMGHPQVAIVVLQVLAARLRRTNDAMADLVFTDVPGRVAKALLSLAERFGGEPPPAGSPLRVEHGLTQEELAQLVGASRETVNKALADFAARGWIATEPRAVTLLDPDRLRRRAR